MLKEKNHNYFIVNTNISYCEYDKILKIASEIVLKNIISINQKEIYEKGTKSNELLIKIYLSLIYFKSINKDKIDFEIILDSNYPDFLISYNGALNKIALTVSRVTDIHIENKLIQFNKKNLIKNRANNNSSYISIHSLLSNSIQDEPLYEYDLLLGKCVYETCNVLKESIEKYNNNNSIKYAKQNNILLLNLSRIYTETWNSDETITEYFDKLQKEILKNLTISNWLKHHGQAIIAIDWADRKQQERYGEISFHPIVI